MHFTIEQDNDGQFHWRLIGDDGAELALSSGSFGSRQDARRAVAAVRRQVGSASEPKPQGSVGSDFG